MLAISALVLSGILLVLGIGHATFLAGPKMIAHSVELSGGSGLFVIDAEQFDAVPGQANVVVRDVEPFVGYGQNRDVEAWVAPFGYSGVRLDPQSESLGLDEVAADAEAAKAFAARIEARTASENAEQSEENVAQEIVRPSPAGSDLWLDERSLSSSADVDAEVASEETAEPAADAGESAEPAAMQMVRMPVSLSEDQSVLVAVADPEEGAELTIEWVQNRRMPLVGPLLTAGGVLAVLGLVLYLLAVDHDRRGLGPRRGRKGPLLGLRNQFGRSPKRQAKANGDAAPASSKTSAAESIVVASGRRRATALAGMGLIVALGVSGCSSSYWPDFSESQQSEELAQLPEAPMNVAPVPLTPAQIKRIVSDVAAVSAEADGSLDASGLASRFRGDALTQRQTNYAIRSAVPDYEVVVPGISDEILGYQLVQSTEGWPRTVLVVVDSVDAEEATEAEAVAEGDAAAEDAAEQDAAQDQSDAENPAAQDEGEPELESPSLALIMTQLYPQENFMVARTIALRGGIAMPEAAPAEVGTAMLANDLTTLVMPPAEVGAAYAMVLAGGVEVEEAEHFDLEGDTLVARSGTAWVAQATEAASAAGQDIVYSVSVAPSESRVISLSTGVGGAIVATTLLETRTEIPAEDSNWRPTVSPSMAALSGLSGRQDVIRSTVAHQLLFYVPSSSSNDPIQLLGYTSDLIAASNG